MNREGKLILRAAVGGYLVYLAYKLITAQQAGDSGMNSVTAYISAAALSIAGAVFCCYALAMYMKDKKSDGNASNANSADVDASENEEASEDGGDGEENL